MRFLIVTPDFPTWDGGVAVWAEKLADFLTRGGHDVTVATPRQLDGDNAFDLRQKYKVHRLPNTKDRYLKYFLAAPRLKRFFRHGQFDQILALTWFPYANGILRHAGSIPLTLFAHGNDFLEARWQRPFWKKRMQTAFAGAKNIIAVSRETDRVLRELIPGMANKIHILFPAVDPDEFVPGPPISGPPVLLSLGRIVARKGQDMVVRALPAILKEFPEVEYWIAGRGSDADRIKLLAAELGVQSQVRFLGLVDAAERVKLYQSCTAYLMPSRTIQDKGDFEGFGITYLEANACCKPVIGGRSGGVADAVLDGETGLLVDPNSSHDIAEKTLSLLRNPDRARQLGCQGRERIVERSNWKSTTQQFLKILDHEH